MRVEDTFDYNNLRNENIFQGKRQVDIKWAMNSVSCVCPWNVPKICSFHVPDNLSYSALVSSLVSSSLFSSGLI